MPYSKNHLSPLNLLQIILIILFLGQALFSLGWRFVHDGPLLQYVVYLTLERGRTPYVDIFDINLPGTHFFFRLWLKIFGYGDLGFRLLDLIWLAGILGSIYALLARFGRRSAMLAAALVGLTYLCYAPLNSLQREWIIALPLLIALNLTVSDSRSALLPAVGVGLLFGFIFLIKPHAIIGWIVLMIYKWKKEKSISSSSSLSFVLYSGLGFIIGLIPAAVWFYKHQAWGAFLDIARNYYPLHSELDGGHQVVVGFQRWEQVIAETFKMAGNGVWALAAVIGYGLFSIRLKASFASREQRGILNLLGGLSFIYAIYPSFSGQFWAYHYALFQITALPLAAVTWGGLARKREYYWLSPIVIVLCLIMGPRLPVSPDWVYQLTHRLESKPPKYGRVDEIAEFLSNHLEPGDQVQPLDWTGGAVHGCLNAKADLATSFVCDAQFYHHIDTPYIKKLRARFIEELTQAKPRYIIEITASDKPWPTGPGTSLEFPELRRFLTAAYEPVVGRNGYIIYQRIKC